MRRAQREREGTGSVPSRPPPSPVDEAPQATPSLYPPPLTESDEREGVHN